MRNFGRRVSGWLTLVFVGVLGIAVYDAVAHQSQDARVGVVMASLGVVSWGWIYFFERRPRRG